MRLFLEYTEELIEKLILGSTGFYINYSWDDLPEGYLPIVHIHSRHDITVAFSRYQLNDMLDTINTDYRQILIVKKELIREFTELLDYCIEKEQSDKFPELVIEEGVVQDIAERFDSKTLLALWNINKEFHTLDINKVVGERTDGMAGDILHALQKVQQLAKFYIRHSKRTALWPEPLINCYWEDIVLKIINKKLAEAEGS